MQHIIVAENPSLGRYIALDHHPDASESCASYWQTLIAPFTGQQDDQQLLILGGGNGGLLNALLSDREYCQTAKLELVEQDIDVLRLSQEHLQAIHQNAFDHPKVTIIVGDAFSVLNNARRLDGILMDLNLPKRFRHQEPSAEDSTHGFKRFLKMLKKSLKPDAWVAMRWDKKDDLENIDSVKQALGEFFTDISSEQVATPLAQALSMERHIIRFKKPLPSA